MYRLAYYTNLSRLAAGLFCIHHGILLPGSLAYISQRYIKFTLSCLTNINENAILDRQNI